MLPVHVHVGNNLANLLAAQGELKAARKLHDEVYQWALDGLGPNHPDTAAALFSLAGNQAALGELKEAKASSLKVYEFRRKAKGLGPTHPDTILALDQLGKLCIHLGEHDAAENYLTLAVKAGRLHEALLAASGSDRATFRVRMTALVALAQLRVERKQPERAWEAIDASLARGLVDDLGLITGRTQAEVEQEQKLREAFTDASHSVASALAAGGSDRIDAALRLADDAGTKLLRFRDELDARWPVGEGGPCRLEDVQRHLPKHTALVGWEDILGYPEGRPSQLEGHWVYVVRAEGPPTWVRLRGQGEKGNWTQAERGLAREFLASISAPPDKPDVWKEVGARLYAQRVEPLMKHLGPTPTLPAVTHLIVLPSSLLGRTPIEPILACGPKEAAGMTVSYAPSARVFTWLREQQANNLKIGRKPHLLAIAAPDFTQPNVGERRPLAPVRVRIVDVVEDSQAARLGLRVGDLITRYAGQPITTADGLVAATAREGNDERELVFQRDRRATTVRVQPGKLGVRVETVLDWDTDDAATSWEPLPQLGVVAERAAGLFPESRVVLGRKATGETLDNLAQTGKLRSVTHLFIGTHGVADPFDPFASAFILTGGEPYSAGRVRKKWAANLDLVVLGTCSSLTGRAAPGEGYLGQEQALFVAGAKTVGGSLWVVQAQASALLLLRFHEHLAEPKPPSKAEALRKAKEWLQNLTAADRSAYLKKHNIPEGAGGLGGPTRVPKGSDPKDVRPYRHPYFWAGFVLTGAPD